MLRIRQIASLLLLALWLPATLHCDVEALDLSELFQCAVDHHSEPVAATPCADDACDEVENGWFKPSSENLSIAAPSLCACILCFACPLPARSLTPPVAGPAETLAAPPEIARTWQFVSRAAPLARAPSFAS